jgi:hypothetical protein
MGARSRAWLEVVHGSAREAECPYTNLGKPFSDDLQPGSEAAFTECPRFRAYSRQLLETIPFVLNSDDFVFDTQ